MIIMAHCNTCGFGALFEVKLNEHGFYEAPQGYCPKCKLLLEQDAAFRNDPVTPEDKDES